MIKAGKFALFAGGCPCLRGGSRAYYVVQQRATKKYKEQAEMQRQEKKQKC
jgi:hypothetical protein